MDFMETVIPIVETNYDEDISCTKENTQLAQKLLEAALLYNSFGANVLPIRNDPWSIKSPLKKVNLETWSWWELVPQTVEDIQNFNWSTSAGIAVVNGVNGFISIDFDKCISPEPVYDLLESLHLSKDYPWVEESGSKKGFHIFLRTEGEAIEASPKGNVKRSPLNDGLYDHLEFRLKKNITILTPSLHISGGSYHWIHQTPDAPPAMLSFSLIEDALNKISSVESSIDTPVISGSSVQTDFIDLLKKSVNEGGRNDATTRLAGHFKSKGIKKEEALEIIQLWNLKNSPPLHIDEIQKTVESIYSYESQFALIKQEGKPTYYSGSQMKDCIIPEQRDLLEGLIREESVVFLAGEEGSGKSIISMNLALGVATGQREFLKYKIKKSGPVLYLNNELPFNDFLERFKKMIRAIMPPYQLAIDNFIAPDNVPPLNEYWEDLNKKIVEVQPVLIILDCLYWAHDKKESDNTDMKQMMRQLVSIRNMYHTTILVVHHTKKGTQYEKMHNDNMRGASVFGGASDCVFAFRRSSSDEKKRLIKPTKIRHGSDDLRKARLLYLNPENLWFSDIGEAREEEHLARPAGLILPNESVDFDSIFKEDKVLARKDILIRAEELGYSERTTERALFKAKNSGILKCPDRGKYEIG
jgi:hypothetical protein